jgi:urease accessory protein
MCTDRAATTGTDAVTAGPGTLLRLMWLASPALPVGAFSHSEGLEAAVEAGLVADEAGAAAWLRSQAETVLARSEAPLAAQAHAAWSAGDAARLAALHAWWSATRETAELRAQSEQTGRALLDWLRHGPQAADPRVATLAATAPPPWPLAFALAGVLAGADARHTLLAFGFGWCENQVQAAIKAVPLGQATAQRVLGALVDALPGWVEHALALGDGDRQAFAPMLAIQSARHEVQYTRIFRS